MVLALRDLASSSSFLDLFLLEFYQGNTPGNQKNPTLHNESLIKTGLILAESFIFVMFWVGFFFLQKNPHNQLKTPVAESVLIICFNHQ